MTNTYDTSGEPLGSTAVKVLYNNASNLDDAVNSTERTWVDRPPFRRTRKTFYGMEQDFSEFLLSSGYEFLGDYDADGPLTITKPNQIFTKDGEYWRPGPALELPYTTVNDWVVDQPKFVAVGDAALRQELAQLTGANLVGFDPTEAYNPNTVGTVLKTLAARNVLLFGAKGDGVTDDTSAIQAVLDMGGDVYFPSTRNGYRVTGTLTVDTSGVNIYGDGGSFSSFFSINNQTFDIFNVTANSDVEFRNLFAIDFANRGSTPGQMYFIRFDDTSKFNVLNCGAINIHSGILAGKDGSTGGGANSRIEGVKFNRLGAATGVGVHYGGNGEIRELLNCIFAGPGSGADGTVNALAGVRITGGTAIVIDNVELPGCGTPLLVQPLSGSQVAHTKISKVWCDSSSSIGMWLDGTAANIINFNADQCWFSSNGVGIRISGFATDVTIMQADIYQNRSDGVIIDSDANVLGLTIGGGTRIGGNVGSGISVGVNVGGFRVTDCNIGTSSHFGANGNGVFLNGSNDSYDISHNAIYGNAGEQIHGHGGGASTRVVKNNIGYATEVEATVAGLTDGSGLVTVTHNMGRVPAGMFTSIFASTDARALHAQVVSFSTTQAVLKVFANNALLTSTSVNIFFRAYY